MKFNTLVLEVRVGVEYKFWIDPYLQGCMEIMKCLTSVHSDFEVRGSIEQLEDRLITWKRESMSVTLVPVPEVRAMAGSAQMWFQQGVQARPGSAVDLHNDGLIAARSVFHPDTPRRPRSSLRWWRLRLGNG